MKTQIKNKCTRKGCGHVWYAHRDKDPRLPTRCPVCQWQRIKSVKERL